MSFIDILRKETLAPDIIFDVLTRTMNKVLSTKYKAATEDIKRFLKKLKDSTNYTNGVVPSSITKIEYPFDKKIADKANANEKYSKRIFISAVNKIQVFQTEYIEAVDIYINMNLTPKKNKLSEIQTLDSRQSAEKLALLSSMNYLKEFIVDATKSEDVFSEDKKSNKGIPVILESMLNKKINNDDYNNDFNELHQRGFVNSKNLRKIGLLLEAFENNKTMNSIPIKGRLAESRMIFTLLNNKYTTTHGTKNKKMGYEILTEILIEQGLPVKTTFSEKTMMLRAVESFKGIPNIDERTKTLQRVFRTITPKDDLIYFKDMKELQHIIFRAEQSYANMLDGDENKIFAEVVNSYPSWNDDTNQYDDIKHITNDSELIWDDEEDTSVKRILSEVEDFKIYYTSLAWLVFKLKDKKLSDELKIDQKILDTFNLNKEQIYKMYDSDYGHINLKGLTTELTKKTTKLKDKASKPNNIVAEERVYTNELGLREEEE